MRLLALDPGSRLTAWVLYDADTRRVVEWGHEPNEQVRTVIRENSYGGDALAVEMIASYGMPVGAEVFETCVWIGRFLERYEALGDSEFVRLVYRREVKMHLCGSMKAKDGNIRQALIDRYGDKDTAIGRKASPGPLYGLSGDGWAALGVAVTAAETCFQPALVA